MSLFSKAEGHLLLSEKKLKCNVMKKVYIQILFAFMIILSSINIFATDGYRRFTKPLDEETEERGKINNSFSDYIPFYSNSVFVNYNISRDSFPQNETSVKISRKNPNRVVAAWRDFRQGVNPANRRVGYSYSTDGGITWSVSKLLDSMLLPGFLKNSDPAVGVDTAGNFYIAVICISNTGALAVYKSTDQGVTFPSAYLIANDGSEDKEFITTDFTDGSPYKNTLYISWTRFSNNTGIKLTRSINGGANWTDAIPISDSQSGGQGSDVAVGLDGELYVTWLSGDFNNDFVMFDKSTNGGNTFGTDMIVTEGLTPSIPISSSNVTFPSISADITSGSGRGNIYITFCDARKGDPDIFLVRSTNRGANWSTPLRINDDEKGNGKLQCWPWIETDDSGNVDIVYFDSRNTTSNTIVEAYLAHSTDQGLSFTNHKLSTVPTPTNQPNNDIRFGDYIGIDSYGGRIVPVWTDERAGGFNQECYTSIVSLPVSISSLNNEQPSDYILNQNYPNPFNPGTVISYQLGSVSNVSIKVYNILGIEVSTLVNTRQNQGMHEVNFNATVNGIALAGGTYFCRLVAEDLLTGDKFISTRTMILLK